MFKFIVLSVCAVFSLFSVPYFRIDGQYEDNCIIKMWFTALGLVNEYEKGLNAGFEIQFNCNGKHYNPDLGPNWWNYYFAFNSIGERENNVVVRLPRHRRSTVRFEAACTILPERACELINKYMPMQPILMQKFEKIKQKYWQSGCRMIGVYYQNPILEKVQHNWTPEELCIAVRKFCPLNEYKILLFTDREGFNCAFEKQFGSHFLQMLDGIDLDQGEISLLTLWMLSQCDLVLAPGSYQSIGAKMLNPQLELIELDPFPYAIR